MFRRMVPGVFALLVVAAQGVAQEAAPETAASPKLPEAVENFRLTDQLGRSHELYRSTDAPAVVLYFYGLGCPIVRQSVPNFNRVVEEYGAQGVQFFMISASTHDTREEIAADAQEFGMKAPILMDESQAVTRALGATRTAEAIVLDPKNKWKIIYRGAIDDRFDYGAQRETAEHEWLREALNAHLKGEALPASHAQTKGCLINLVTPEKISYATDIVPILEAKCVSCHVDGGVGPFAMANFKKVRGWAPMIRETILTRQMPPWHADPHVNSFENSRALTAEEERKLLLWIEQDAEKPEEEPDPLVEAAAKAQPTSQWALGEPDLVVQIPEAQTLPAEGTFDYRYFYVPVKLDGDKWLKAVDVQPGNRAVLHHALVFIIYPDRYEHIQPDVRGGLNGFFASFLPGMPIKPYPDGSGQFLPDGSILVFQMHYNATGKEEVDQTKMGLYLLDEPPARAFMIKAANETEFEIPPHTADYVTKADWCAREDAIIYGLSPHMHYRGSRFKYTAQFPDGKQQELLNVPFYQFDWQPLYMFAEPLTVPAETVIQCEGAFDNSKWNPRNPDPSQSVRFGEQSWEEMFIGYIALSVPRDEALFSPREVQQFPAITEENLPGTEWRMGRRFSLIFNADKTVSAQGNVIGKWKIEGNKLILDAMMRKMEAIIHEDDLIVEGRRLRRVVPGEELPEAGPRDGERRRERREGQQEQQGQERTQVSSTE